MRTVEKATQHNAKRHDNEMETLRGEMASLRDEVRERLLQCHLQLGRLASLVDGGDVASLEVACLCPPLDGPGPLARLRRT